MKVFRWHVTMKISDVIVRLGSFLKLYSEFINNYKQATNTYDECMRKKRFAEIARKFEVNKQVRILGMHTQNLQFAL